MSTDQLDRVIGVAIAEGILPQGTRRSTHEQPPWPVILLTALGAWLVAIPLILFIAFVSNGVLIEGVGPYLVGGLILSCTVALLRNDTLPPFAEHFAVPGLLVGGATLGYGLDRDLGSMAAAALMALLSLAIAALIRRNWLRVLLGGLACGCTLVALVPPYDPYGSFKGWLAIHIVLGAWVLAQWLGRKLCADTRLATLLEWVGLGWILVTLAQFTFSTGTTFLVEATFRTGALDFNNLIDLSFKMILLCSGALAACAGAWLIHCWPSLRQWWCGMAALVLVALATLIPPLGATLLVLAIFCAARRWRLAMAAGAAAVWIIGAFYYQFSIPLATKALMMAGAGALLAACSWWALRGQAIVLGSGAAPANSMLARIGIAVCALAVLAVVNVGIWQKETLISKGRPVFVELVPVDPRSLMQGDYMQLAFQLPERGSDDEIPESGNARAVGKIDPRGVLTLDHLANGTPLAPGELAIELTRRGDSWMLVTDAWYFKEGDEKRWSRARYGEFRVDASGRAQLTGLRGAALEAL